MGRPYSIDLRARVISAIESGLSCHQAAAHFRVAVSGYRPRVIRGEHCDWLLERCRARDFTLRGLIVELARRGLKVGYRPVWTFVHAEGLSHKKMPSAPANRIAPTSPAGAPSGGITSG